jgi:hypothetical protein
VARDPGHAAGLAGGSPASQAPELFLNRSGEPMTRDGFAHRLEQHVAVAARKQPSLLQKRVTPHVLRHSCAMRLAARAPWGQTPRLDLAFRHEAGGEGSDPTRCCSSRQPHAKADASNRQRGQETLLRCAGASWRGSG